MRCLQYCFSDDSWHPALDSTDEVQLVLAFGSQQAYASQYTQLQTHFPRAQICGCTTAGEISAARVYDNTLSITTIQFSATQLNSAKIDLSQISDSRQAGVSLAEQLPSAGLKYLLVLADGLQVNGSELAAGLSASIPQSVSISGGLAGDGDRFETTGVWLNQPDNTPAVIGIGFYSEHLQVGHGSMGGWDPFGPQRRITKAEGNVVYEIDHQPALALYKRYLGPHANDLPGSGLLFPLSVSTTPNTAPIVRSIIAIDEKRGSMTFAGDMPQGAYAQLMKANVDRLVDGAERAAEQSLNGTTPSLALLISSIGRKMVLKQRVEEELEAVQNVLGKQTMLTGFYSYGELSPHGTQARCALHNQTMTITTLFEVE